MTYLELCRRLRQECAITGTASSPAAVTNQTGEMLRIVEWIKDSWNELQGRHPDWKWMRKGFTLTTVGGTGTYAYGLAMEAGTSDPLTRFSRWWAHDNQRPFTIYLQSGGVAGERDLSFMPWEDFRRIYRRGVQQDSAPAHVSVDDADQLVLGPAPNDVYVVQGEYQRSNQVLAANGDVPEMHADFHMLVMYDAMKKYAAYESAPEVFDIGNKQGGTLMRQLEARFLPQIRYAEPLA